MNTLIATSNDFAPPESSSRLPRFLVYMRYPAFSREWFWRRTKLFASCVLIYTFYLGVSARFALQDGWLAIKFAVAGGIALMIAIAAGPFFASIVTQRKLPIQKERRLVLLGVMLGTVLGVVAFVADNTYSNIVLADFKDITARMTRATINLPGTGITKTLDPRLNALVIAVIAACTLAKYFFLAGGFALRSYFTEQRRAAQARQQRELTRLKVQKHESDLQLAILQAQIEPHFLFNTLASVHSLIVHDQARAAATVDELANYLRATLPKLRSSESSSTLGEQLDICASYLELMRLRLDGRFSFSMDVPPDLRSVSFPSLLLMPLLENAITHGIEPKTGPGSIHISAVRENTPAAVLRVNVIDDGVGLHTGVTNELGQGVGLANIRAQLALRFGDRASLNVSSRASGGTSASLTIPTDTGQARTI